MYNKVNRKSPTPIRKVQYYNGGYFNPSQYGLGGLIGSGLGLAGGSLLGNPALGMQIGGAIGGQFDKTSTPEEHIPPIMGSGTLGTFKHGGKMKYKYGGKMKKGKGGYASPLKRGYHIEGQSHEDGGVMMSPEIEVEGNETMDRLEGSGYVFSDRLKVPNSKMTFAEKHKQLVNMGADKTAVSGLATMQERVSGRESRNLGNKGSMDWKTNNAVTPVAGVEGGQQPMIMKTKTSKSQETGAWNDPMSPMVEKPEMGMAYGGKMKQRGKAYKTYSLGGYTDRKTIPMEGLNTLGGIQPPTASAVEGVEKPELQKPGMKLKDGVVTTGLQLAPDIINAASGLLSKNKTGKPTQVARARVGTQPIKYNVNPILESSRAGYRGILSQPSASPNERLGALAQTGRTESSALADKANKEMEMTEMRNARQAGLDSNRNAQQASMDERQRQDHEAAQAQLGLTGNFFRSSAANIANKLLQMKAEKNRSDEDQKMIDLLLAYYGGDRAFDNTMLEN